MHRIIDFVATVLAIGFVLELIAFAMVYLTQFRIF